VNAPQARSFGELLRQYRVAAGLTQETLAERAHMSTVAIGALERGTRQRPYRATIRLLAEALSLSANDRLELERAAQRGGRAYPTSPQVVQATVNLPVHFSSFVGREQDLTKVGEMLATQRLVTLVGAGGVGKTRLAIRAAEHFIAKNANDGLDGAWFVDLSSVNNVEMAMAAIASSVGMEQCRSLDTLIQYLKSQRFLLTLDNCEHLVGEAGRLAGELLRHCPRAQILATSRQALGLDGERIYRVPPLDVPMADADAELSPSEALAFGAIRLFADRAEAADSRFELTPTIIPAVAEICRRLDGIALAIELAAARTNALPTATIAQRLDEHFMLLAGGMRSPSRHKTMQAVFDWSYGLLDENERSVFRQLSIFVGGFTLDLATSLLGGNIEEHVIIETLASLVDKSLVQCDPYDEPPRYKMLEPARQYCREKLREHGEQNAAARAHASALLAIAESFDSRLELTPDHEWDAYIERERDNFRSAFEWTFGPHGDALLGQRLAGSRTAVSGGFGSGEVRRWVSAARESCNATTPPYVMARLAIIAARAAITFDRDPDANLAASRRALRLQQPGDLRAIASAQYLIGVALQNMGRLDDAANALRETRLTARSCGANLVYVFATKALSAVHISTSNLDEARTLISEVLLFNRAAGSDRHATEAAVMLAEIEFASGNVEEAVKLAEDASDFFRAHANFLHLSMSLSNLSAYLVALGRYEEGRRRADEALRRSRALGRATVVVWAVQHLAAIAILSGHRSDNARSLRRAANVLGFVNESTRQLACDRFYTEQQEYDKMLFALREVFDEDELAKLLADGKEWSEDQAVAETLAM